VNVPETPLTVIFPETTFVRYGESIGGVTTAALLWAR
jgi:hypothetical protein